MFNPTQKKEAYKKSLGKSLQEAINDVKDNKEVIKQYVVEHGQKPEENIANLAAQALLLHEAKIWDKVENYGIPDYEAAENEVLAEEQSREDSGEISNFGGGILGSVFKAGSAALKNINAKRVKNGKKPLLDGEKGKKLQEKIQRFADNEDKAAYQKADTKKNVKDTALKTFVDTLSSDVERKKTNDAIKKYLPYAIIILIAVFFLGKKINK